MSQPPLITLHVSRSPLLPELDFRITAKTGSLLSALLTKRVVSAEHAIHPKRSIAQTEYTTSTPPSPTSHTHAHPTPAHRHSSSFASAPSSQMVIALLNMLDQFDADVAMQVARVKDSIAEAHECIDEYKQERLRRQTSREERWQKERKETKEIGSDFWLGV
ncbi:hypothetical protein EYR40_006699 [Pleurotus pulmonarius]|nr:hypothetical protein EYR36_011319 [Pleurotus pulmonarius]KAF4599603.1 hypothetical protein EYR40_006699 [Pleurotus pulmonarius]